MQQLIGAPQGHVQGLIGAPQGHVQGLKVPHSHMHSAYDYGALLTPAHDTGHSMEINNRG